MMESLEQLAQLIYDSRFVIRTEVGPDTDDLLQDLFLEISQSWLSAEILNPGAYIRTAMRHKVAEWIIYRVTDRSRTSALLVQQRDSRRGPLSLLLDAEKADAQGLILDYIYHTACRNVSPEHKEIIRRCLEGQTEMQVRREMHLTGTQFRLLKSRSKALFAAKVLANRRMKSLMVLK